MQNKRLQWDVTLGPSFQQTSYDSTTEEQDQLSGVVAIGTLLEYRVSSRIDYIFYSQLQFVEENSGKRNSHLKTGLEFTFTTDVELDVTFTSIELQSLLHQLIQYHQNQMIIGWYSV